MVSIQLGICRYLNILFFCAGPICVYRAVWILGTGGLICEKDGVSAALTLWALLLKAYRVYAFPAAIFFINIFSPLQTVHEELRQCPLCIPFCTAQWQYKHVDYFPFFFYHDFSTLIHEGFRISFCYFPHTYLPLFIPLPQFFMIPVDSRVQGERGSSGQQNNDFYTRSWANSCGPAEFALADFVKVFLTPFASCCCFNSV